MIIEMKQNTILNLQPLHQCVPVTFHYDIHFTTGLFQLDNPLVAQVIAADKQTSPNKAIAVVDSGVLQHHPKLLEQLAAYTKQYGEVLKLSANPLIVPGGEDAKNDRTLVNQIHQLMDQVGLCRHSYVLAIGGGAVLDLTFHGIWKTSLQTSPLQGERL